MTLSQQRLAMLAAMLPSGSATERVKLAVEIWQVAGTENPDCPKWQFRQLVDTDRRWSEEEWLPLDDFLRQAMPKKSKADRMKTYRDSLASRATEPSGLSWVFEEIQVNSQDLTTSQAGVVAGIWMEEHRKQGITNPRQALVEFNEWKARQTAKNLSIRGKKGKAGSVEKAAKTEKAKKTLGAKKTTKRKPKQSKTPRKQPRAPRK